MTKTNLPALNDLARRIKEEHHACRDAAQSAVEHAVVAGQLLLEAKAGLPHGQWLPWLNGHCNIAERTSQAYMRLARELPKLEPGKAQRVADLPLRKALAALSEPRPEPTADIDAGLAAVKEEVLCEIAAMVTTMSHHGWTDIEIETAMAWVLDKTADHGDFLAFLEEHHGNTSKSDLALMRGLREIEPDDPKCKREQGKARHMRAILERLGESRACGMLADQGLDKLPPGLSALLTTITDETGSRVTIKPEFVFAMAACPKASVQAMLAAQILEAAPGAELTPMGLKLPEGLPFENWKRIGELLMAMPGAESSLNAAQAAR